MTDHEHPVASPRSESRATPAGPESYWGTAGVAPPAVPSSEDVYRVPIDVVAPPPRRRASAYAAVAVGILAMVGGGVFFARSLGKSTGGADSPAAAVQRMFDAIGNEDVLGVLESLLPSERDMLRQPLQDATKELGRLGVLREGLDLTKVSGVDLEFSNLAFGTTDVGPGVSTVTFRSGTVRYRVDPAQSPLGEFVRGFLPPSAEVVEGTDELAGEDARFTTVKEGNRWYVSIWYSMAEQARVEAGLPAPNFGSGLAARGAETPEKAAEEMIRAAVALDVRRLIELTPPTEARALHDYAPLFIDAAQAGAAEARRHYTADIRSLKLSSHETSSGTIVKIDSIVFDIRIPEIGVSLSFDGKCATFQGEMFGFDRPQRQCGGGFAPGLGLPTPPTPDVGIVTVNEGGQWYVSPTRTLFDGIVGTLRVLKASDLEQFKQLFLGFMGMGMSGSEYGRSG